MRVRRGRRRARRRRQPRARGSGVRRLQPARAHRQKDRRSDPGALGGLRPGRRDHARAHGLEVADQAHRGRPRAAPQGDRVPGQHRRALQPRRRPTRGRPRGRVDLDRDGRAPHGRVHGRRDPASDQDDPAVASLLALVAQPLEGTFSAEHSARLLRNYRYVVERTMRALGGWIALTPELSAKLLMGRHVWDLAQHCDAFGQRLPELRSRAQVSEAANPAVATFMDAIEDAEGPDQTIERLVGVYGVVKPHLLTTYRDHLARANPVYEPPTRRILARCIDDEERHIAAGVTILKYLAAGPRVTERVSARRRHLEGLLAAAGGVTGAGLPARETADTVAGQPELSDDAHVAGDDNAVTRLLVPGLALEATAWPQLHGAAFSHHVTVAFARLGHQRLVKTRLEGPSGSATVLVRWTASGEG